MSEIILPRTGDRPLIFDGDLIAESRGHFFAGQERNRWHNLRLYRTEGGRYVLAIAYRTQWQGEASLDEAVVASSPEAVAMELRTYDPFAPVTGYPPGEAYREKQTRLEMDLRRRFAAQVAELFEGHETEFAERID